jgi:hypothetical protein
MPGLIGSGHVAVVIMLFTLFELAGLAAAHRIWHFGPGVSKLLPSIAAGDFLLLAWGLSASHWALAAAALAGALAAHGFDIVTRLYPTDLRKLRTGR